MKHHPSEKSFYVLYKVLVDGQEFKQATWSQTKEFTQDLVLNKLDFIIDEYQSIKSLGKAGR
jgi:hypothetical protein